MDTQQFWFVALIVVTVLGVPAALLGAISPGRSLRLQLRVMTRREVVAKGDSTRQIERVLRIVSILILLIIAAAWITYYVIASSDVT